MYLLDRWVYNLIDLLTLRLWEEDVERILFASSDQILFTSLRWIESCPEAIDELKDMPIFHVMFHENRVRTTIYMKTDTHQAWT